MSNQLNTNVELVIVKEVFFGNFCAVSCFRIFQVWKTDSRYIWHVVTFKKLDRWLLWNRNLSKATSSFDFCQTSLFGSSKLQSFLKLEFTSEWFITNVLTSYTLFSLFFAQSLMISFKVLDDRLKKMFITLADEGILISFLILQIMRVGWAFLWKWDLCSSIFFFLKKIPTFVTVPKIFEIFLVSWNFSGVAFLVDACEFLFLFFSLYFLTSTR